MSQWVTEIHIFRPGNSIFIGVTLKATEASSGKLASGSSSNICCVRGFLPGKLSICRIVHVRIKLIECPGTTRIANWQVEGANHVP